MVCKRPMYEIWELHRCTFSGCVVIWTLRGTCWSVHGFRCFNPGNWYLVLDRWVERMFPRPWVEGRRLRLIQNWHIVHCKVVVSTIFFNVHPGSLGEMIQFDLRIFFKWVGKTTNQGWFSCSVAMALSILGHESWENFVSSLVRLPCFSSIWPATSSSHQSSGLALFDGLPGLVVALEARYDLDQSKKLLFDTRKSGFQVWPGNFWYHTQAKIRRTHYIIILLEMVKFPDFQTHPRLLLKLMWCFYPGLQGGVLAKWWTSTWDRHLGLPHMFDYYRWPCLIFGVLS